MNPLPLPEDKLVRINNLNRCYLNLGNPNCTLVILPYGLFSNAHYRGFSGRNIRSRNHVLPVTQRGHGDSGWANSKGPKQAAREMEKAIEPLSQVFIKLEGERLKGGSR